MKKQLTMTVEDKLWPGSINSHRDGADARQGFPQCQLIPLRYEDVARAVCSPVVWVVVALATLRRQEKLILTV